MKLHGEKALLVFGITSIAAVGWLVMATSPMPDALASPHARVAGLDSQASCGQCHANEGLAAGCLKCHSEIQTQLTEKKGYHHELLEGKDLTCGGCHKEHSGADWQLVSQKSWGAQTTRAFKHPHVEFGLEGKHSLLECEACHESERAPVVSLPGFTTTPRTRTFLGLSQACKSCHSDVHSGGLTPDCRECHGQDAFEPTVKFDHAKHFPLVGGHDGLACKGCHVIPDVAQKAAVEGRPFPFPFNEARGKTCVECHQKPHHAASIQQCEDCHGALAPHWQDAIAMVTPEQHEATGFRLLGAHQGVECARCHPRDLDFDSRYPNPSVPGYQRFEDTCQGCHRDVHKGQFQERHTQCLDCHDRHDFSPTKFGHAAHAARYPLDGGHAAVACTSCHQVTPETGVRAFAGTSHVCKDCHKYPHGEQFRAEIEKGDCTTCHSGGADTFHLLGFDHKGKTGYPLAGAHARAQCNACHVELPEGGAVVRKYRGNPRECGECHKDVHRGQFVADGKNACSKCHASFSTWDETTFNHNTMSRFHLEGAHAVVACQRCHQTVTLPDGASLIQYKPLGVECKDCHEIVPGTNPTALR